MVKLEDQARVKIDEMLDDAGWHVCDIKDLNLSAYRGIAVREFPLPGRGFAGYLSVNGPKLLIRTVPE